MPRIYLAAPDIEGNLITITDEKARYLSSVLRCQQGDTLLIFDGSESCIRAKMLTVENKKVIVEIQEQFTCNLESRVRITLVQGLLKGEKMDVVVQKTTELGVHEIMPVVTARSQIRETRKIARWRKIAEEASRQSGRSFIPMIHEPLLYPQTMGKILTGDKSAGIIFYEEGGACISAVLSSVPPSLSDVWLLIGPEGGFTGEEVARAQQNGFVVASLGKRILRAETAAIAALSIVQYHFGSMD